MELVTRLAASDVIAMAAAPYMFMRGLFPLISTYIVITIRHSKQPVSKKSLNFPGDWSLSAPSTSPRTRGLQPCP